MESTVDDPSFAYFIIMDVLQYVNITVIHVELHILKLRNKQTKKEHDSCKYIACVTVAFTFVFLAALISTDLQITYY